ncbi:MAG TPA: tetratricopeptide repeat protein [Bryobacteraceae bacterium]|nr:tetratricopeptide repeat protein [Bryobacteraceae bacterium]
MQKLLVAALAFTGVAWAQAPAPATVAKLAETGDCRKAMPLVKAALVRTNDPALKKRLGLDGVQCAMSLKDADTAEELVHLLRKQFPHDPEVLYIAVHLFSDLSLRASEELAATAPGSYQMHELNAEAMEAQGKPEEAIGEFREVLKKEPDVHGIHYRIGRLLLSGPNRDPHKEEARREFEEELKIDPSSAASEYVLGELARQEQKTSVAMEHFTRATKLDGSFADAFIGLGRTLIEGSRAADALSPLQTAAKLQPDNPAPHLYLATAYRQLGRQEDASRESERQREASEKLRQAREHVRAQEAGIAEESK